MNVTCSDFGKVFVFLYKFEASRDLQTRAILAVFKAVLPCPFILWMVKVTLVALRLNLR